MGLASKTVDRPLVAHGVGGQAKVVLACEVPVGIAGLPGIMSLMVTMDRIPWLVPVGLMKAMGGHVRLPEAEIQWPKMRRKPISKIEYVRSGHPMMQVNNGVGFFQRDCALNLADFQKWKNANGFFAT